MPSSSENPFGNPDVIVIGAGNAAACAALAAREQGASVIMIEAAPKEEAGGNSRYTAGAMRVVFNGPEDLKKIIPDLTDAEIAGADFGSYTTDQFYDDMGRLTEYRTDPDLAEILITRSLDTLIWMQKKGVKFQASFGRQAHKVDGKFKFFGGLACETWGGGEGLVDLEHKAAMKAGVQIFYDTPAIELIETDEGIGGVKVRVGNKKIDIYAKAVILACGGFESNAEMRAKYLGPNWDLAKVRGTRFNTGGGLNMALNVGAMPYGQWSGCHSVSWDLNAPPFGDLVVGDSYQKHSYPFGIMINARGERFVDEGADIRNYTYAKYGKIVLEQPNMFAWQVFDAKISPKLRDEYRIRQVTKVQANTLEELATLLEGVDAAAFLKTVQEFNAAVMDQVPLNLAIKDGRGTKNLTIPKSNWANAIDTGPFEAYAVTCGVTFTFGGIKINNHGEVENTSGKPIPGLYAAGEIVGGLFYYNYPGGTGLTSGSVFGKIAGDSAGKAVSKK